MDERGLQALLCVLVVVGCSFALVPSAVLGDPAVDGGVADGSSTPAIEPASATSIDRGTSMPALQEEEENATLPVPDSHLTEIEVAENGTAFVTLEYEYLLEEDGTDDGNESDAGGADEDGDEPVDWEELNASVDQREDEYVATFEERWSETATEAANETGREEMAIRDVSIGTDETTTPHEYGYVRVTFVWEEFAYVELPMIEIGDAIEEYELDDHMRLVIAWPESHEATSIEPQPDDRRESAAVWDGDESEFFEGEPTVEVVEASETGGDGPAGGSSDAEFPATWLLVGGVALALTAVGAAGWWYRSGRTGSEPAAPTASAESPVAASGLEDPPEGEGEAHADEPDGPPPELLSNEEHVLRLLEERGGRMKQQEVVSELDWTEAKTSQVVTGLREDDEIDVFRIGRENVLTLPDDEREE
ncbi:helix-turn-helix transcriptional regulator [Natrialbaceae archaeon GCM10025810]|uniref:helix-turn-helix transcriptional regulator n=1 Tax=Halovalidus salilacus TaxID=3075124 RepID=UPI00360DB713